MKKQCYPKYSYIILIVISAIFFVFSIGPLVFQTGDHIFVQALWSFAMASLGVVFIIVAIHYMQYFYVEGEYIILRSAFGTMVKLHAKNVMIDVETLPTYESWVLSVDKKWICLYDKNSVNYGMEKFKSGCSNSKKFKRIQIIFSEENQKTIDAWIKEYHIT